MTTHKKKAVIIGGGPAGLTAAYEFLRNTDIYPVVFEQEGEVGGISRTIEYKGNRMDIGGHRFFSKNQTVMDWWVNMMPVQGSKSRDEILLDKENEDLNPAGKDPEQEDRVMLVRQRVSRIFYLRKFFDYPISLKLRTFLNMGVVRTLRAGGGYMISAVHKRQENSLEDFYINRFGKPLYKMFFEDYTTKVWGIHPSCLGADWGAQRVKGLSLVKVLKEMFKKNVRQGESINQKNVETSLIEKFIYPKYGPGQLWETVAEEVKEKGGEVILNACVTGVQVENQKVVSVTVQTDKGTETIVCDYLLSSMPLKELIPSFSGIGIPGEVKEVALQLPYRDFITVGLLVRKLKIKNHTRIRTFADRIPDTWIYIQERDVKIGRLQVFNNWSPYLVGDYENSLWIGLEYFCSEGDEMWNMGQEEFIRMAIDELVKIDIVGREDVLDAVQVKIKKAYPSYHGSYYQLDRVKDFLNGIDNLYCIGRNGQHKYNNMDHSMLSAMVAVENIRTGQKDKTNIWSVNTEKVYHESK